MRETVRIFDASNVDEFRPAASETMRSAAAILPLVQRGVTPFITNVKTDLQILTVSDQALPITINDVDYGNSYVTSPYGHYIEYAGEELRHLGRWWLTWPLKALLRVLAVLFCWGRINRTVHINNWLLSTNLYPPLTVDQIGDITDYMAERFPRHALIFRSVNDYRDGGLLSALQSCGYRAIASRQVYFQEPSSRDVYRSPSLRRDRRVARESGYEIVEGRELNTQDISRLELLYRKLYLEKYSLWNPQFTERFIKLAIDSKYLQIYAFRKGERVDGFVGYFIRDGVLTTPLLGYDTDLPQEMGLYRILTSFLVQRARDLSVLINASSGAAGFKRARGGRACIEYSLVRSEHLPWRQRWSWRLLEWLANGIGIPLMRRFKL